jgi:UDP-N-acetylmuramoyl-L-alanyl-D-glutamate--2,6-diaminopimelate ligase
MIKSSAAPVLTYGIDKPADLFATEICLSPKGMRFIVNYQNKKLSFESSLIGRFNVRNLLAAIGAGLSLDIPLEKCVEILQKFSRVPGRLERVANARALNIFVDYAHTPDALKNVLETLCEIKKGRIITVFGCGGNRDQGKRPKMGAVAEALSDVCIVTSDNPRSEEPQEILNQIVSGFKSPKAPLVLSDRREAILSAIKMARADDLVLIAGKGHETYQIFAHQTLHFDDRIVAKESVELAESL